MKLSRGALLGRVGAGVAAVALAGTAFSAVQGDTTPRGDAATVSPAVDPSQAAVTATNGTNKVAFADGHTLTLSVNATDGAWPHNGSRMAFVDSTGAIRTVRFDNQNDVGLYVAADG